MPVKQFDPTGRTPDELDIQRLVVRPFRDFGRMGQADDSATVQYALDESAIEDFAVGEGSDIRAHGLVIRNGTKWVSPGEQKARVRPPIGSGETAIIHLDVDVVQNVVMKGFKLEGTGIAGQRGLWLKAVPGLASGILQGGLWYFTFEDLEIRGFASDAIWLHGYGNAGGDPGAFRGPIQFGTMRNVRAFGGTTTARALRLSGQVGQIQYFNCEFDNGASDGFPILGTVENVLIERAANDDGSLNSDMAPYDQEFYGLTCQGNKRGVTIERSSGISFFGGHFENLYEGIVNSVSAWGNLVQGTEFANVGHKSDGSGYGVLNMGGKITVRDLKWNASTPADAPDKHYISLFNQPLLIEGGHHDDTGIRTQGITHSAMVAANTMDLADYDHIWINGSATLIDTLTSMLPPGRLITIHANAGSIRFGDAGNINLLPYRGPLVIPDSGTLILQRNDLLSDALTVVAIGGPQGHHRPDSVFVNAAMSPYQAPPGVGTIRVDTTAGNVTIKLPAKATSALGERVTVKRISGGANTVFVNGATTAENPDGQGDNVVKLTGVTQSIDFERNGLPSAGGWDTVGSSSLASGTVDSGDTDSTANTLAKRDTNGLLWAQAFRGYTQASNAAALPGTFTLAPASHLGLGSPHGSALEFGTDYTGYCFSVVANGGGTRRVITSFFDTGYVRFGPSNASAVSISNAAGRFVPWLGPQLLYAGAGSIDNAAIGAFGDIVLYPGNVTSHATVIGADGAVSIEGNGSGFVIGNRSGTNRIQFGSSTFAFWNSSNAAAPVSAASFTVTALGAGVVPGTMYYDISLGGITTISKDGATWDWSIWNPAGSTAPAIALLHGTFDIQIQSDLILNTANRGLVVSSVRRLTATTAGIDVTGTLTASSTVNFITGAWIVSTTGISSNKTLTMSLATGARAIDIADSSGHTGISFTPASSSFTAFVDQLRVGAHITFRTSSASAADTTWLDVFPGGTTVWSKTTTFGGGLTVQSTAGGGQLVVNGTTSNVQFVLTPATSGDSAFFDMNRVGSTLRFRTSNGSTSDTTWLVVPPSGQAQFGASIKTAAPSGAAGAWLLGQIISATVALDTTKYIQVSVDGVVSKIALVT